MPVTTLPRQQISGASLVWMAITMGPSFLILGPSKPHLSLPSLTFQWQRSAPLEGDVTNTTNVVMLTRMGTIATTSSVDVVLTGGSALAGTDFTAGPITVNFSAGQSTAMVPIELLGETVVELDETINLSLTNFVNSQAGTTQQTSALTIQNDDSATISIGDATITEGGQLSFSVSITNPVDVNVTMDADTQDGTATTADSDYTALVNDPVSFSAGTTTTQTVIVQTTTDNKVELNETLLVILGSLNAGGRSVTFLDNDAQGSITNDDSATISIGDATITEGGTLAFDVTITNPVDVAITADRATMDGTATTADSIPGIPNGNVQLFAAGSTSTFTINVNTTADNKVELDEVMSVVLSNLGVGGRAVTFADATGDGTITNDDSGTISINDVSMNERQRGGRKPPTFTFTVTPAAFHSCSRR